MSYAKFLTAAAMKQQLRLEFGDYRLGDTVFSRRFSLFAKHEPVLQRIITQLTTDGVIITPPVGTATSCLKAFVLHAGDFASFKDLHE